MLGRQHLKLTVMTYTALVAPFVQEYFIQALIGLLGASIGSLIPDIDSVDAAVFHSNVKGLGSPGIVKKQTRKDYSTWWKKKTPESKQPWTFTT